MGFLQSMAGMADLTEQVIATDLLIAAKSGVRNYAAAIAETASPDVRSVLRGQLRDAIESHGRIFDYMTERGYYHPYDHQEQIRVDVNAANTVLSINHSGLF